MLSRPTQSSNSNCDNHLPEKVQSRLQSKLRHNRDDVCRESGEADRASFSNVILFISCPPPVFVKDGNVITTLFRHESRTHTGCPTLAWTLPVSSLNRRPAKNDSMFETRPLHFLHAVRMRRADLPFFFPQSWDSENLTFFISSLKIHKMWLADYFYTRCLWPPVA